MTAHLAYHKTLLLAEAHKPAFRQEKKQNSRACASGMTLQGGTSGFASCKADIQQTRTPKPIRLKNKQFR